MYTTTLNLLQESAVNVRKIVREGILCEAIASALADESRRMEKQVELLQEQRLESEIELEWEKPGEVVDVLVKALDDSISVWADLCDDHGNLNQIAKSTWGLLAEDADFGSHRDEPHYRPAADWASKAFHRAAARALQHTLLHEARFSNHPDLIRMIGEVEEGELSSALSRCEFRFEMRLVKWFRSMAQAFDALDNTAPQLG